MLSLLFLIIISYGIPHWSIQQPAGKELYNPAILKFSWMSSYHSVYGNPFKVSDGFKDDTSIKHCAQTADDNTTWRWWRVDLEYFYDIYYVTVTNRGDCCGFRLKNFTVLVAMELIGRDEPFQGSDKEKMCNYILNMVPQGGTVRMDCNGRPIAGRYVTLILQAQPDGSQYVDTGAPLHICEVEVFALRLLFVDDTYRIIEKRLSQRQIYRAGGSCNGSEDRIVCEPSTFCQLLSQPLKERCVVRFGRSCAGKENFCEKTTVCDSGICRIRGGQNCQNHSEMCQSSTVCTNGKCMYKLGAACHVEDTNLCLTGICEAFRCRMPRGSTCNDSITCVSGASCQNSACRCQKGISRPNGKFCVPVEGIVGGACTKNGSCNQQNAFCNTASGQNICQCRDKYVSDLEDFSCRVKAGQSCNTISECSWGTKCDGEICRLNLGENCVGPNKEFCEEESVCDKERTCKYEVNRTCDLKPSLCKSGSICEDHQGTKLCKLKVGQTNCTEDHCIARAKCEINSITCKLRTGQLCAGNDIRNCHSDAVCDHGHVCRNIAGKSCGPGEPCKLGVVCEDNVCKLRIGADCAGNENFCRKGLICDQLLRCKLEKGGDCAENPDMCLAGADCVQSKCQCNDAVSYAGSSNCKANPFEGGGSCSKDEACRGGNSVCNQTSNKCTCVKGYAISPSDLSCKLEPGADCSSTPHDCMAGTVCDSDKKCKLKLQENCAGPYRGYCGYGLVCAITGTCLLGLNGKCDGYARESCEIGKICDASNTCRNPIQENCGDNTNPLYLCMAGSYCAAHKCQCNTTISKLNNQLRMCVPFPRKAGGSCKPTDDKSLHCEDSNAVCSNGGDICQCIHPFAVSNDLTCKLIAGESCTDNENCVTGTTCDGSICKLVVGNRCSHSQSTLCQTGSLCDFDSTCKLDYNGDCLNQETSCRTDLACDNSFRCRIPVGGKCSFSEDYCVSGAYCSKMSAQCACVSKDFATEHGTLCFPADGRIGGKCTVDILCQDPSAFCNEAVQSCHCTEGYNTDFRTYSCISKTEESKSDSSESELWLQAGLPAMACAAIIAGIALFIQRRRTNAEIKEERKTREAIEELADSIKSTSSETSSEASSEAGSTETASSETTASDVSSDISDISDQEKLDEWTDEWTPSVIETSIL